MGDLLAALRAAAEPTRLRLLVLCARGELTVSELAQILGQSQPRVSRHLKLSATPGCSTAPRGELGLLPARRGQGRRPAQPPSGGRMRRADETIALDLQRLAAIKRQRAELAAAYFRENAPHWHRIRSLYVDEREVEAALPRLSPRPRRATCSISAPAPAACSSCSGRASAHALGIDQSREMLAVARVNLEQAGLRNCIVRLGDMYQLPLPDASFDAVVIHQVLHYADRPAAAIAEAARVLRPGGASGRRRFRAARARIPARRACPSPARLRRRRCRRMVPRRRARTGPAAPSAGRPADRRDLDRPTRAARTSCARRSPALADVREQPTERFFQR